MIWLDFPPADNSCGKGKGCLFLVRILFFKLIMVFYSVVNGFWCSAEM